MKNIEQMTDHEMIVELMKDKRKRDSLRTVKTICIIAVVAVLAVGAVMYVPKIISVINEAKGLMVKVNELSDKAGGVFDKLGDGTIEQLKSMIESLSSFLGKLGL